MAKREMDRKLPPIAMPVCIVGSMVDGRPNFCTVAWFTMIDDEPPMIGIVMGKKRRTKDGMVESKAFSVNIPSTASCTKTDYVGICSGYKVDKSEVFERLSYGKNGAPMIEECPVNVECDLERVIEFEGVDLIVGKIVQVRVDGSAFDGENVDLKRLDPLLYAFPGGPYMSIEGKVADAFEVGKKLRKQGTMR